MIFHILLITVVSLDDAGLSKHYGTEVQQLKLDTIKLDNTSSTTSVLRITIVPISACFSKQRIFPLVTCIELFFPIAWCVLWIISIGRLEFGCMKTILWEDFLIAFGKFSDKMNFIFFYFDMCVWVSGMKYTGRFYVWYFLPFLILSICLSTNNCLAAIKTPQPT